MSYILDALRKSEKRRKQNQNEHAPLRTARIGKRSHRIDQKRIGGLILTGCIFLAVMLLGIGWWWSSQVGNEPVSGDAEVSTETVTPAAVDIAEDAQPGSTIPQSSHISAEESAIEKQPEAQSEKPPPAPSEKIIHLTDLAPELQARIMNMKFSGHVYSPTPALRMIMIDNAVMREGAAVAPELTLVEITENGLIMQTGSARFTMKLF